MKSKLTTILLAIFVATTFTLTEVDAAPKIGKVKGLSSPDTSITTVTLKWNTAKRAKAYQIYQLKGKKYRKVKTVKVRTTKIKNLKPNKVYQFKVRGIRGKRKGKFSKVIKPRTRCKVTFVYRNNKGKKITTVKGVKKGATAKAPTPGNYQTKTHKYTFDKWSTSLKINKNVTITASYKGETITPKNPNQIKKELLVLINEYRKSKGLNALVLHEELSKVAEERATEAHNGYFDEGHYSTISGTPSTSIRRKGLYSPTGASENLCGAESAKEAFEKWKASSTHNINMLRAKDKYIGIGLSGDIESDGGYVFINMFVQNFETPPDVEEFAYYNCSYCGKRQQIIQDYTNDYWTCINCNTVNRKQW